MGLPHRRAGRGAPGGAASASLAALLMAATASAAAHPHGSLDCAARVQAGPAGLSAIDLTLTLDAASSASLQPRLQAEPDGAAPANKDARLFADLVAGMFRQSGWMLRLQPLGADGEPQATPLALDDPGPATWRRTPQGRLQVSVRLQPETAPAAGLPVPTGYRLACLDPDWYWATGFAGAAQFTVDAPCRAALDAMGSLAEQARTLQSAAQRAGVVGADQAAPGLLDTTAQRAPGGLIHCPTRRISGP